MVVPSAGCDGCGWAEQQPTRRASREGDREERRCPDAGRSPGSASARPGAACGSLPSPPRGSPFPPDLPITIRFRRRPPRGSLLIRRQRVTIQASPRPWLPACSGGVAVPHVQRSPAGDDVTEHVNRSRASRDHGIPTAAQPCPLTALVPAGISYRQAYSSSPPPMPSDQASSPAAGSSASPDPVDPVEDSCLPAFRIVCPRPQEATTRSGRAVVVVGVGAGGEVVV